MFFCSNLRVEFDSATHFAAVKSETCVLVRFILRAVCQVPAQPAWIRKNSAVPEASSGMCVASTPSRTFLSDSFSVFCFFGSYDSCGRTDILAALDETFLMKNTLWEKKRENGLIDELRFSYRLARAFQITRPKPHVRVRAPVAGTPRFHACADLPRQISCFSCPAVIFSGRIEKNGSKYLGNHLQRPLDAKMSSFTARLLPVPFPCGQGP